MITTEKSLAICLLAILTTAPLPLTAAGDGPQTDRPLGDHIKVNFRMDGIGLVPAAVLAVEDAAGELVMLAYVDDDVLFISDGVDRPYVRASHFDLGRVWHRLDVVLHGPTYTVHVDQREATTAQPFHDTTQGTWVIDPQSLIPYPDHGAVLWAHHRVDNGGMAYDATFTLDVGGWEAVGDPTRITRQGGTGYRSPGQMEVRNAPLADVAYLRAPTAGMNGTYSAEAALNVVSNLVRMDGTAALAGTSGDASHPTMQWMIEVGRPQLAFNQWALFLRVGDTRTQLAPGWPETGWHTLRVQVDESADRIVVHVDDHAPQAFDLELGESTHVAAGDLDAAYGLPHNSPLIYDELALYEEAS